MSKQNEKFIHKDPTNMKPTFGIQTSDHFTYFGMKEICKLQK